MEFSKHNKSAFPLGAKVILSALSLFFLAGAPGAAAMADSENFLVSHDYDYSGRSEVPAQLIYTSDHAYLYMERDYFNQLSASRQAQVVAQIKTIGQEFDATIYPQVRRVFGEEWNPGIDQDSRIVILFTRLDDSVGGYFNPNDEYDKDSVVGGESNQHEMIYLNPDFFSSGKTEGFLAHEFQHMVYWNEKYRSQGVAEEVWINEARSELASALIEEQLGKKFSQSSLFVRKADFLADPTDSLVDWDNSSSDYASVSLFMQYVKDHFGTDLFRSMDDNRKLGASDLDYVLRQDEGASLPTVFTDWTLANYINDTGFDKRDGYEDPDLKTGFNVVPTAIYDKDGNQSIDLTSSLKNWSANYYQADLSKLGSDLYLKINFDGDDEGEFSLPVVINYKDGSRRVDLIKLDGRQAGGEDLLSLGGNIRSLVFIPSSEKLDDALRNNQAQSYGFALSLSYVPAQSKVLPDGSLVRQSGTEKVYLIEGGKKRWITDSATFASRGYAWSAVNDISAAESSLYREGDSISSQPASAVSAPSGSALVRGSGPEVYLLENNQRRWIPDAFTFTSLGYDWGTIRTLSDTELGSYSLGTALTSRLLPDGTLLRGTGARVYLLEGGKKRWIVSPEAFSRHQFSWAAIVMTSDQQIETYADGPAID